MPLHLEHDVAPDRVVEFKSASRHAVLRIARAISGSVPSLDQARAIDVITAANALPATLWRVTRPAAALRAAIEADPSLSLVSPDDFRGLLARLLAATGDGLAGRHLAPGKGEEP